MKLPNTMSIACALLATLVTASCAVPHVVPPADVESTTDAVVSGAGDAAVQKRYRDSIKYGLPLYVDHWRYDDNPPVLPEDYPAKSDDAANLLRRLLDLVNGPDLNRERIEKEFGIRFVPTDDKQKSFYGIARGRYPLGDRFSFYRDYGDGKSSIDFVFTNQIDVPQNAYRQWGFPKVCVLVSDLYGSLDRSWKRIEQSQGHHYPFRIYYEKLMNEKSRTIESNPFLESERSCIESIYILDR